MIRIANRLAAVFAFLSAIPDASAHSIELRASIVLESIGLPNWRQFRLPLHPGIQIGAGIPIGEGSEPGWALAPSILIYRHRWVQWGLGLRLVLERTVYRPGEMSMLLSGGVGFFHNLYYGPAYAFEKGGFGLAARKGKPEAMLSAGLGITAGERGDAAGLPRLLLDYETFLEFPAAPGNGIPALPHTLLRLGSSPGTIGGRK